MFSLILFEPEIPPNTGNIIRLCANTGASLHLVGPLGFDLEERKLRRAGLDECLLALQQPRVFGISTRGEAHYCAPRYQPDDAFLFGPETRGLPADLLDALPAQRRLRLPMQAASRSLNLSNAAAVVVYEAWRQLDFAGAGKEPAG